MNEPTRGVRNNNPGNIRLVPGVEWVGQCFGADTDFCTFSDPKYGVRAIAEILHSYWVRDGIRTISGAIMRWAPPTENNTGAYMDDVAQRCAIDADEPTTLAAIIVPLIEGIIAHENGNFSYPTSVIQEGIALAGL